MRGGDMLDIRNVHALDHFKRQTAEFRKRLKTTGQPEILTVDGRAELVVQDAAAYQDLVLELETLRREQLEELRTKIHIGFQQSERGELVNGPEAVEAVRRRLTSKAKRARGK